MPFIAAFTAAEIAAAEAALATAAEAAAAEAAAATAAQAAAAETAAAAVVPEALPATSFAPQAGIMEALPGQLQNIQNLASSPGIQFAGLDASAAANAIPPAAPLPAAGSTAATTAGNLTPLAQTAVNSPGITGVTASAPPPVAAQPTFADFRAAGVNPASMIQPPPPSVGAPGGPTAFEKFSQFAKENKFLTGAGAYLTAYNLGMLDPRGSEMPQRKPYGPQYRLSENFQTREPTPNVYTPSYTQYAEGGIASIDGPEDQMPTTRMEEGDAPGYARGGTLSNSLDFYKEMAEARPGKGASAPKADADVGIYYDQDPDTRYQDALTASQIRQSKLNKRSNVQMPTGGVMRRPAPMGQINLAPPGAKEAAQEYAGGGITGSGNLDLSIPLDIGGGGGGGGYGGGGSYRFANSSGAAQTGFTGNNNAAGGGFANFLSGTPSIGRGMPALDSGMFSNGSGMFIDSSMLSNGTNRSSPDGMTQYGPNGIGYPMGYAAGGIMQVGDSSLGGYAAGGSPRLLKGPGDGMSDNIPAMIGRKQPARLADGEFVIPADVVSHLGNGSTEAGAKRLHEMMNNVRKARTGNPKQGKQINPKKYMPA